MIKPKEMLNVHLLNTKRVLSLKEYVIYLSFGTLIKLEKGSGGLFGYFSGK